ncbi:MAG: sulfatase-like hydrolase/transferase [Chloroflexi bacterium]|nr:sulfatase-like hydrolase/transferase [Chloroflexota bacterium]
MPCTFKQMRPNIVWLTSDHLLYAHHRQLTGYPHLPTYDQICADGLTFDNAFSVTSLCQPCRGHEQATLVDTALGQIVATLDRLGLRENTIVIYTVDHGGALGSNGQLVDKGWVMTDETIRIPMGIRCPDEIEAGSVTKHFVTNMDITGTVLDMAGAAMPEPLDGRSLRPLFHNPQSPAWPEDVLLQHHGHYGERHFQRQVRYGRFKYTAHLDDLHELYDIEADPFEMNNLVNNPNFAAELAEMQQRLGRLMNEFEDNAPDAVSLLATIALSGEIEGDKI